MREIEVHFSGVFSQLFSSSLLLMPSHRRHTECSRLSTIQYWYDLPPVFHCWTLSSVFFFECLPSHRVYSNLFFVFVKNVMLQNVKYFFFVISNGNLPAPSRMIVQNIYFRWPVKITIPSMKFSRYILAKALLLILATLVFQVGPTSHTNKTWWNEFESRIQNHWSIQKGDYSFAFQQVNVFFKKKHFENLFDEMDCRLQF